MMPGGDEGSTLLLSLPLSVFGDLAFAVVLFSRVSPVVLPEFLHTILSDVTRGCTDGNGISFDCTPKFYSDPRS